MAGWPKGALERRWREAASLIVTARKGALSSKTASNYGTLMLRRVDSSSFTPSMYTFPGGLIDKADFAKDWLDIFSSSSAGHASVLDHLKASCSPPEKAAPTFVTQRPDDWKIPAEIAFKICALRETFEESGVLLVRSMDQPHASGNERGQFARRYDAGVDELREWTARVRSDASHFATLCRTLNCVPDIWSLHPWSLWLTPSHNPKRFDTPFFLACLDKQPEVMFNLSEHTTFDWVDPQDIPVKIKVGDLALAPPQVTELSRLGAHADIDQLSQFAARRAEEHGVERWCPLRLRCPDGFITAFPGDSLYGNFLSGERLDMKTMDLLKSSPNRHVLVSSGPKDYRFYVNIPERRGHLWPRSDELETEA